MEQALRGFSYKNNSPDPPSAACVFATLPKANRDRDCKLSPTKSEVLSKEICKCHFALVPRNLFGSIYM